MFDIFAEPKKKRANKKASSKKRAISKKKAPKKRPKKRKVYSSKNATVTQTKTGISIKFNR